MTTDLINWMTKNNLPYQDMGMGRFNTALGVCLEILPDGLDKVISLKKTPTLIIDDYAQSQIDNSESNIEYFIYKFGGRYYYTKKTQLQLRKFELFRYKGEVTWGTPIDKGSRAHMAIHGKYELMCGLHEYSEWVEKVKFLGFDALGIAEHNTLAGAIQFTKACKEKDIKPILGLSTEVIYQNEPVGVKLYAANEKGWENIMYINSLTQDLELNTYLTHLEGVIVLIEPNILINEAFINFTHQSALRTYFQFTTVSYRYKDKDLSRLQSMKWFIRDYKGPVQGLLSDDSYCLEKDQEHLKKILIKQGGTKRFNTDNHSLNTYDISVRRFYDHFDEQDKSVFQQIVINSGANFKAIIDTVTFEIPLDKLFLPEYEMTPEQEAKWGTKENMFKGLIGEGLQRLDFSNYTQQVVLDRIRVEGELIKRGGFIDYFLILWDIIDMCVREGIETGPGRGSAAGSIIAYLLGITKLNPLDYDLLFERFLNESRIESELPDIDIDFASDRRDEVLKYMRDRYGFDYVCQVGTYGTLKLKSAVKELNRYYGKLNNMEINYIAKLFSNEEDEFFDLFKVMSKGSNKRLADFIRDNYSMLHDVQSLIGGLKSNSIHACATIIVPKIGKNIYKQIPIRVHEDGTLVSEWEGNELADAGYLKEDILSTKQMAKINMMIRLVKKHHEVDIKTDDIPLDDVKVFELFKKGFNSDVFHFGSSGLTTYLTQLQPDSFEDLIAAISLYRPGAMASDAHMDYVKLKKGEKSPEYGHMIEEVTKSTFGLIVYQEQIMKICQVLSDFTLTEADGIRKATGKKLLDKMESYEKQFIDQAVNNQCPAEEAQNIWDKIVAFAAYSFNKSHAAAYANIGYICNWFKVNYPFEFWITTFEFSEEKHIPQYLSEISKLGEIRVLPPDINKSTDHFEYDIDTKTLYWDLNKVKFVADAAIKMILIDREKNGQYFSIDEFMYRMDQFDKEAHGIKTNAVNKRVMERLIFAGAFDNIHQIDNEKQRYYLMERYYQTRKDKLPEVFDDNKDSDYYWPIKQYETCKLSHMDYKSLVEVEEFAPYANLYVDGEQFNMKEKPGEVVVIGMIQEYEIKKTKKGDSFALIQLLHNTEIINIRVWPGELNSEESKLRWDYVDDEGQTVKVTLEQILTVAKNTIAIFRGDLQLPDQWKNHNELVMSRYTEGPVIKIMN